MKQNGTKALKGTPEKTAEFTIECDVKNGPIYLRVKSKEGTNNYAHIVGPLPGPVGP